ncbi:unnamed protein product [Staurois parvus]|uniref:Uncharacterized protein n=3 Tax=Staurois parvus TaxID=386267 RepID=A0ABN9DKP3_9NEOB|nr:unnamed protein product [Staurois parvus]
MVGVTGQVQQVASSVVQRVKQRDGQESDRNREQEQDTGPKRNTTPRQSLWVWPSLKYPSIISSRCSWLKG